MRLSIAPREKILGQPWMGFRSWLSSKEKEKRLKSSLLQTLDQQLEISQLIFLLDFSRAMITKKMH